MAERGTKKKERQREGEREREREKVGEREKVCEDVRMICVDVQMWAWYV